MLPCVCVYASSIDFPSCCYHCIRDYLCAMSNSGKLASVIAAAGEAQLRLLYCPTCPNTLASGWFDSTSYDWCLNLVCCGCQSTWSVCRLCRLATSRIMCRRLLSRHNARSHRPKVAVVTVPATARAVETTIHDENEQKASSMMDAHWPDANKPDDYLDTTLDHQKTTLNAVITWRTPPSLQRKTTP